MSAADALRMSAIRRSEHACPDKLKRLLSHPDPEFRTWTSGWKVGGSRVRNGGVHPGVNGGSQVQIQTRICCPDALRWCIRTHCLGIVLAFWIFLWQRTSKLRLFMFLSFPLLCHGFQITFLNLRFALVIKKLSKHQNLTVDPAFRLNAFPTRWRARFLFERNPWLRSSVQLLMHLSYIQCKRCKQECS